MGKLILPKHLTDTESVELIHGPPSRLLRLEDFRPYQSWMSGKIMELPGVLLGAEMGLGKTGSSLWAMVQLLAAREIKRPLIVAPLRVAEETWPEELRTWTFCSHLTFRVVTGTLEERIAALAYSPAQVTIINRENLRWLHDFFEGRGWPFDMLIYDEISRLKRGIKRVSQSREQKKSGVKPGLTELGVIESHRRSFKRVVGLSGTPAPNGLIDLWGPMCAIDHGKRLGLSITAYKKRWFRESKYDYSIEPMAHSEREIMGLIDDVFFSLREEDYLSLPPMIPVDHLVDLPEKARRAYDKFEQESAIELRNAAGDNELIEAVNNGVLTQKLLQIANGSVYTGEKWDEMTGDKLPRESIRLHDEKLGVLESIMEEAAGTPVLVAYSFQFDRDAILKRFPYCRLFGQSPNDMRDWNAGRIKMLLTHPASAGHGLNFQHGSNIMVWYGLTWSLELYRQFIKRLHRSGQKAARVFLHRIIARNTVDEDVLETCLRRGATQDQITDAVRVRLERVIRMAA